MLGKSLSGYVSNADELILRATVVQVLDNRPPHLPLRWLIWCARLAPYAKHRAHLMAYRSAMAPKQDHCGCPVAGDIRPGGINHMCQVNTGEEFLNQLFAEFALHERIGGDHADIAGWLRVMAIDSQVK